MQNLIENGNITVNTPDDKWTLKKILDSSLIIRLNNDIFLLKNLRDLIKPTVIKFSPDKEQEKDLQKILGRVISELEEPKEEKNHVMDDVERITKAFNASSPEGKETMLYKCSVFSQHSTQ